MKKIFIIATAILSLLLVGCTILDKAIIEGYYDKEEYYDSEGFQDFTDYCKYYYSEEYEKTFSENELYSLVEDKDISNIKSYFENFKEWISLSNRSDEYNFDESNITS